MIIAKEHLKSPVLLSAEVTKFGLSITNINLTVNELLVQ